MTDTLATFVRYLAVLGAITGGLWAMEAHWIPRMEHDRGMESIATALQATTASFRDVMDETRCVQFHIRQRNAKQDLRLLELSDPTEGAAPSAARMYAVTELNAEIAALERAISVRCAIAGNRLSQNKGMTK